MRYVKPLDTELIYDLATRHPLMVTIEENTVMGGAGSACLEAIQAMGLTVPVLQLGLPDTYIDHGDPVMQLADCGLDATGIEQSVQKRLAELKRIEAGKQRVTSFT